MPRYGVVSAFGFHVGVKSASGSARCHAGPGCARAAAPITCSSNANDATSQSVIPVAMRGAVRADPRAQFSISGARTRSETKSSKIPMRYAMPTSVGRDGGRAHASGLRPPAGTERDDAERDERTPRRELVREHLRG